MGTTLIATAIVAAVAVGLLVRTENLLETDPNLGNLSQCMQLAGIPSSRLILRGADSDSYAELNYQWLTVNGQLSPAAYFLPGSAEEVAVAVRCSTASGVRVVARSGGHSYLKLSFGDEHSLVVDLSRLNSVQVNMDTTTSLKTVRVGAGARGGKIQHDLWAAGAGTPLLIPTGMCPQVGISGYALGGGLGYYARHYGTATDNILELELVDAEGSLRTVNNDTDPDLFWALRGAGATSFGIVTQVTFRVHVAPKAVLVADIEYDFKDFVAVFSGWQNWLSSDPPSHLAMWALFYTDRITFQFFCMVDQGSVAEEVEAEFMELLATYFPPLDTPPLIRVKEYSDWLLEAAQPYSTTELTHPAELVNLTHLAPPRFVRIKSFFVDRLLSDEAQIKELEALIAEMTPFAGALLVEQRGGTMDRLAKEDTAFIHRRVFYEAQVRVHTSAEDVEALEAMETFFEGTKAVLGHTESYQNYLDEELDDWLVRYYGKGLDKLKEIKRRLDPGNVFHNPRSIPLPSAPGSGTSTQLIAIGSNAASTIIIMTSIIVIYFDR